MGKTKKSPKQKAGPPASKATTTQKKDEVLEKIADLETRLSAALAEKNQVLEELTRETEAAKDFKSRLEETESKCQQLKEENGRLSSKIEALEKSSAREIGSIKSSLREAERQGNQLRSENKDLLQKINELENIEVTADISEVEKTEVSATTSTFKIYLSAEEGNYRGRIEHILSKEVTKFTGLDFEAINNFIGIHKPQPPEAVGEVHAQPAQKQSPDEPVTARKKAVSPEITIENPLQNIMLNQSGEEFEITHALHSHSSFKLHMQLLFSKIASLQMVDTDQFAFQVDVIAKKSGQKEEVKSSGIADIVPVGSADYDCQIDMPPLDSGNYDLHITTIIPEIQFMARDKIAVAVGN